MFRGSLALRSPTLSRLPFLAAALIALAVFFAPGAQPASADHGDATTVWSATLTVKEFLGGTLRGCDACASTAVLTDNTFDYGGSAYRIETISNATANNALEIAFDKTIPASLQSALVLKVGSEQFPLADATLLTQTNTNDLGGVVKSWDK